MTGVRAGAVPLGDRRWLRVGAREARRRKPPIALQVKRAVADRLVFSKIRARAGGRLRFLVSGSAPLSPKLGEFFLAIGLPIVEGYGLTETSPGSRANRSTRRRLGHGRPRRCRRRDRDRDRTAKSWCGVRTSCRDTTAGRTRPRRLTGGWFHTGDIGQLEADGYLTITDRKKDLIVTSGGKKIAPQPLEGLLKADPLVAEAVVIGEQRKFPAVLIVPDFARLEARLEAMSCAGLARGAGRATPRSCGSTRTWWTS